jgi:hypothetical protein
MNTHLVTHGGSDSLHEAASSDSSRLGNLSSEKGERDEEREEMGEERC